MDARAVSLLALWVGCSGEDATTRASSPTSPGTTLPSDPCEEVDWYQDSDGDGFGHRRGALSACTAPEGYVAVADDCDDSDRRVHPDADETPYDALDNDCDPATPDDDLDADGFPSGQDCDDADPLVTPLSIDRPDGIDNDCDGSLDQMSLAYADASFTRYGIPDLTWTSAAGVGDVDGDGNDDLMIGVSSLDDYATGRAYLLLGPLSGTDDLGNADAEMHWWGRGETGTLLAGRGDVNGDAYADVLVGSTESYIWDTDYLAVLPGPVTGNIDLSTEEGYALITLAHTWDMADQAVFADLGGGPTSDLVIGDWGYGRDDYDFDGAAWVVYDTPPGYWRVDRVGYRLEGGRRATYAGERVDAANVDGDGTNDILIGTGWDSEEAYVVLGPVEADLNLDNADIVATSTQVVDLYGDVDGDGHVDLLTRPLGGPENTAAIVLGPVTGDLDARTSDIRLEGHPEEWTDFEPIGDFEGDGLDDIVIGEFPDDDLGSAYLLFAPTAGTIDASVAADVRFDGQTAGAMSVTGVGDIDADGLSDLVFHMADEDADEAYVFVVHSGW